LSARAHDALGTGSPARRGGGAGCFGGGRAGEKKKKTGLGEIPARFSP